MDIFKSATFPDRGFLINSLPPPGKQQFIGEWETRLYENNLKVLSSKYWKYSNPESVSYESNDLGFRENKNFDDIDWKNTSVLVGCSFAYGHCCENENTITEILKRDYGVPFVNAGIPGSSNRIIHNNAITFMKKYNPKKVIIMWSYPSRNTWVNFNEDKPHWRDISITLSIEHTIADRKKRIVHDKIPSAFYDVHCDNTIHEWMTAMDTHTLLGNKQYFPVDESELEFGASRGMKWIKAKNLEPYERMSKYDVESFSSADELNNLPVTLEDLQKPEIYEIINKMYARDLKYDAGKQKLHGGHYGEQKNRDIADLIYRENFK